ncbi:hypothetical protein NC652_037839 [Populus alba x Populus x berolinensis]|nr:hypothetical protein NC652_037839 [Populus alba x Populus x berolinensis]
MEITSSDHSNIFYGSSEANTFTSAPAPFKLPPPIPPPESTNHFPYQSSVSVRISMSSTMEQSTSEVSRTKIFKKFWKMCIGQVCCPSLCSVGSWLHPIHLEILLNVKHITRQFNPSKELFMFDLGSFG